MSAANVDHGLFPLSVCVSFSSSDKIVTFDFGESIVKDDSVKISV